MNLKETYLDVQAEIRKEEAIAQKENKPWGAGLWFVNIVLIILTAGGWLILMLLYWFLTINLTPSNNKKKLEELYALRDEAELKLRMGA